MKKVISIFLLTLLCFVAGSEVLMAKDTKAKDKNEVIVYALSPAPSCQNCVNKIKSNLRFEKGVKEIDVDLTKKSVSVTYSPKSTTPENLVKALKKIGYTATPYNPDEASDCCSGGSDACPVE